MRRDSSRVRFSAALRPYRPRLPRHALVDAVLALEDEIDRVRADGKRPWLVRLMAKVGNVRRGRRPNAYPVNPLWVARLEIVAHLGDVAPDIAAPQFLALFASERLSRYGESSLTIGHSIARRGSSCAPELEALAAAGGAQADFARELLRRLQEGRVRR